MTFRTYDDIPAELLDAMIELFTRKCPTPNISNAIGVDGLAAFNFESGRWSVVGELLTEKRRREKPARA